MFACILGLIGLKWGFGWAKYGKGWCDIDPQRTRSYFGGFVRLCQFW